MRLRFFPKMAAILAIVGEKYHDMANQEVQPKGQDFEVRQYVRSSSYELPLPNSDLKQGRELFERALSACPLVKGHIHAGDNKGHNISLNGLKFPIYARVRCRGNGPCVATFEGRVPMNVLQFLADQVTKHFEPAYTDGI